jgi:hypothetical protein
MIDGIYKLEIKFGAEHTQGIGLVKGNSIRGLDSDRIYVVEFSGHHAESCWHFSASRYTKPAAGLSTSGSQQITCRENSEKRFVFEGEMTGLTTLNISILGEWIADLPGGRVPP